MGVPFGELVCDLKEPDACGLLVGAFRKQPLAQIAVRALRVVMLSPATADTGMQVMASILI